MNNEQQTRKNRHSCVMVGTVNDLSWIEHVITSLYHDGKLSYDEYKNLFWDINKNLLET